MLERECHLWLLKTPESLAPDRLARYEALLTPDEDRRYRRFLFERHRMLFLMTRVLVRTTLSRYAAVPPAAWRFRENPWGKPAIAEPDLAEPLSFNLSNTEGMAVCLVSRGHPVGIDVENQNRLDHPLSIAERFFSAREARDLRALPPERQRNRFFAYWTLKEAYIKARGMGLAIPLDQFSFLLEEGSDRIRIEIDARLNDDAERWQFARIPADAPYAMALAIDHAKAEPDAARDLSIVVRDWVDS